MRIFLERRRQKYTKKAIFRALMVSHKKARLTHPRTPLSKVAPCSELSIEVRFVGPASTATAALKIPEFFHI